MSLLFTAPTLTLQQAAAQYCPPPEYVFGPLQPGDVGILSGTDGIGKTWLMQTIAATVGYRISFGGIFEPPKRAGRVLLLVSEDRKADHHRRMIKIASFLRKEYGVVADDDMVTLRALEGKRTPLLAKVAGTILETEHGRAFKEVTKSFDLTAVDPLRMFHDLDESDGISMDILIRWLVGVAMENQRVFLAVQHVSQAALLTGRDDHHAGRGATDLPAGCRGVWALRGMSPEEAAKMNVDETARRDWRCLNDGKASHEPEKGRIWLQRQHGEFGGLLIKPGYQPAEFADAYSSPRKRHGLGRGRRNGPI